MVNQIYLNHNISASNLSNTSISELNLIYNEYFYDRPLAGTRKIIILILCVVYLLSSITIYIILIMRYLHIRSSPFVRCTVCLSILNVIFATSYISFFGITKNNIYRTRYFVGHLNCQNKFYAGLEATRAGLVHMAYTAGRYMVVCSAAIKYDRSWKLPMDQFTKWMVPVVGAVVMGIIGVINISRCVPKYTKHTGSIYYETCYEWEPLQRVDLFGVIFQNVVILIATFCVQILLIKGMKKIKLKMKNLAEENSQRLSEPEEPGAIAYIEETKPMKRDIHSGILVSVAIWTTFLTSVPTTVRNGFILSDNYDLQDYTLDEMVCELLDTLLLVNSTFVLIICCIIVKREVDDQSYYSPIQSETKNSKTSVQSLQTESRDDLNKQTLSLTQANEKLQEKNPDGSVSKIESLDMQPVRSHSDTDIDTRSQAAVTDSSKISMSNPTSPKQSITNI